MPSRRELLTPPDRRFSYIAQVMEDFWQSLPPGVFFLPARFHQEINLPRTRVATILIIWVTQGRAIKVQDPEKGWILSKGCSHWLQRERMHY